MSQEPKRIDLEEEGKVIIEFEGEEWEIFVDDYGELAILRPERFSRSREMQKLMEEHREWAEGRARDWDSREST